ILELRFIADLRSEVGRGSAPYVLLLSCNSRTPVHHTATHGLHGAERRGEDALPRSRWRPPPRPRARVVRAAPSYPTRTGLREATPGSLPRSANLACPRLLGPVHTLHTPGEAEAASP